MAGKHPSKTVWILGAFSVSAFLLSGCGEEGLASLNLGLGQNAGDEVADTEAQPGTGEKIKLVERDVEAPEVFEVNEKALWDGRPSLGGVWVAHPDSKQPERVIIRNAANDSFVIGALFRRERDNPGPELQLSSDAAAALGVQAGTPTELRVTALRRETVNVAEQEAEVETGTTEAVATTALTSSDTEELAATALASLEAEGAIAPAPQAAKPAPVATAAATPAAVKPAAPKPAKVSKVSKPFVQIGYFSVEDNAKANVAKMKSNGIPAKMVSSTTQGKTFWRVLAGPAASATEQRQLMSMVQKQGFADAYFVKG